MCHWKLYIVGLQCIYGPFLFIQTGSRHIYASDTFIFHYFVNARLLYEKPKIVDGLCELTYEKEN